MVLRIQKKWSARMLKVQRHASFKVNAKMLSSLWHIKQNNAVYVLLPVS